MQNKHREIFFTIYSLSQYVRFKYKHITQITSKDIILIIQFHRFTLIRQKKKTQFLGFTLNTRTYQFHSNFALGHQLAHQKYIIHSYDYKDRIKIAEIP